MIPFINGTCLKVLVLSGLIALLAISSAPAEADIQEISKDLSARTDLEKLSEPLKTPIQATHAVTGISTSVTPNTPGSPTRLTAVFQISAALAPGTDQIIITLDDDFQVPSTLDRNLITLIASDVSNPSGLCGPPCPSEAVLPQSVTLDLVGTENDEPEITLTVPDMLVGSTNPAVGSQGIAANATVTVVFQQTAGIRNSSESSSATRGSNGTRSVRVRTSAAADSADVSLPGVFIPVRVEMSSDGDPRGEQVTVVALGVEGGKTATFWLDYDGDGLRDSNERDLCSTVAASDDTATCIFTISNPPFVPGRGLNCALPGLSNCNFINVLDGQGRVTTGETSSALTQSVVNRQTFELEPTVTLSPDTAHIGDTITVSLFDYPQGTVSSIEIAGLAVATPSVSIPSSGQVSFGFTIPGLALDFTRIPTGAVRFEVFGSGGASQDTTLTILGATVTPSQQQVVANQDLTILGSHFSQGGGVCVPEGSIILANVPLKIDESDLDCPSGTGILLTSAGTFTAVVRVHQVNIGTNSIDLALLTEGTHELRVIDQNGVEGRALLEIPQRELEASPEPARPGDLITITGRHFIADNPNGVSTTVTVEYQCGQLSRAVAAGTDSSGDFQVDLAIPTNCAIPSTSTIVATIRAPGDTGVVEAITHELTDLPPPRPVAVSSFDLFQDPADGATGVKIDITQVNDPVTGFPTSILLGAFQSRLTYPQASGNPSFPTGTRCVNILEVRDMDIPIIARNIDNDGGVASFNGLETSGVAAPLDLGHALTSLRIS